MARRTINLGSSRNQTGFLGFNNATLVSSYDIPNTSTRVTGALTDGTGAASTERPVRITSCQVFFRQNSAGSVAVRYGRTASGAGTEGPATSTANTAPDGTSVTHVGNSPFFVGETVWSGIRSTNTGEKLFWRGTQEGSSLRFNTTDNTTFTPAENVALNQTLIIDTAPSAPTGISAAADSDSVTLGWGAPNDNGGVAISGYRIAYRNVGGNWIFERTVSSTTTATTVTGLSPNTSYQFAVAALNAVTTAHNSSYTNTSAHTGTNAFITADTLQDIQPALGTITATAVNQTTINVVWSTTNSPTSVTVSGPGMTTRNTSSGNINATGLTANTVYTYTITTFNSANSGNPDVTTSSARTLLPAPTLTITATALTSTTARVVWSTTNATAASITGPNLTSTALSGNEIVTGLTRDTVYRWQGSASNSDGNTGTVLSNQIQTPNVIGGVWTGTSFAFPTVRVWDGEPTDPWKVKTVRVWTGTEWKVWV